ncbi:MAG: AAA family ATPase [Spirochaetes bacterium]|jgi:BioD-like phosphotransacetylase family protein|nr:AAA family ATPase [Spirochaetota bacterium]
MDKIVISSSRESAGKTSIIVGLAKAMGKTYGYIKPFGDRLLYRKKRLWDYDAALVTQVLGLHENPEDITIGFEHSKLRYMYDEVRIGEKVKELVANTSKNKDVLFVEGGKDLSYGVSVHLDAVTLAQNIGGKLIVVVSGNDDAIVDDIMFIKNYVGLGKVDFRGVIINKVHDLEDFNATYLPAIEKTGVKVLGIVPMQPDLKNFTVGYLSECLFAKVIAGEGGLNNVVKTIFVGAMSTNEAMRNPLFNKENRLVVTSGDRSDMVLASLDQNTIGILLTNNILPPSNIISKASEMNIPLLLVPSDTYQVARQIDAMEPLLTRDNTENINLLTELIKKNVKIKEV